MKAFIAFTNDPLSQVKASTSAVDGKQGNGIRLKKQGKALKATEVAKVLEKVKEKKYSARAIAE